MELLKGWVDGAPIAVLGVVALVMMAAGLTVGIAFRRRRDRIRRDDKTSDDGEGYVVSAVLGLLALLLGFTFALAVDRFETRRALVLEEANAIGTAYLRTQLLPEPHRARISGLLVDYAENRVALGETSAAQNPQLLVKNDRLITDLWAATAAGFQSVKGLDFSSAYLESMNALIDLDTSRKAARSVHVPTEVFIVLMIYLVVTAGVLGYVFAGPRGRAAAVFMLALLWMSMLLIVDIDSPTRGGVRESQAPMQWTLKTLKTTPPATYDRWLTPEVRSSLSR
ncbi:MAG: hypothetical protein KA098_04830 [Phenylobacterium sp.]|nr:hypothetical protein [Phenylobacterium sp.]